MKLFHFFAWIISILYGSVVHIRNLLFDIGIFNQKKFESKIIGVGNISLGGTGKTVLIDYLSKSSILFGHFVTKIISDLLYPNLNSLSLPYGKTKSLKKGELYFVNKIFRPGLIHLC